MTMTEVRVVNEPLTYHPHARASFFRDMILRDLRRPGEEEATERLLRHEKEMRDVRANRDARAAREMRAGGVEYRTEPNTTDGTGGYFAPPLWIDELFATANRPHRVLAGLIPRKFRLPAGVSTVNVPIIGTGNSVQNVVPTQAVPDQDVTDSLGTSIVAVFSGDADVSLQLLEQSPPGPHLDAMFIEDLTESYDANLEAALLYGAGQASGQLLGVANVSGNVHVTYTDASPTGAKMFPYFGQLMAQVAKGRRLPPECFIVDTERWAWIMSQEDSSNLPFGVLAPNYAGSDPATPWPIGPLLNLPTFLDEAIPLTVNFGSTIDFTSGAQDIGFCLRPSDMILLEGAPKTAVMREPGSGNLSVRIQMHNSAAFIGNRRPAGIGVVGGTGFAVQSGYGA